MVVLVAMGGGALLSLFQLWEGEGAAEISEIGSSNWQMGELPLFPLLIKREGVDDTSRSCQIKNTRERERSNT